MADEPKKSKWKGRLVIGLLALFVAIRLFERYAGGAPQF